jgi:hypothetical protein
VTPPHDLYEGEYLLIQISGTTVDLRQFNDVPYFLIVLVNCTVTDMPFPISAYGVHQHILFHDCDLSGVPHSRLSVIYRSPNATLVHLTGEINPN